MQKFFKLFFLVLILVSFNNVLAQSDTSTFSISVFGSPADVTPPSTPTLLSATPVATTQIDVSWSLATDDYFLSGYVVSRDGVPIATTTLLNYSDTGLTPSTTYSYTVQAFDAFSNYSSSSNSISTTTLEEVIEVEEDNQQAEGTIARVVIRDFKIETGLSTSSIFITTAYPSRLEIRWGRSDAYELGYIVKNTYSTNHNFNISDLEPGTVYEYEITGYTPSGFGSVIRTGTFKTEDINIFSLPVNVSRFSATAVDPNVLLSWNLPSGDNIAAVRIVRSHLGFPQNPQDGAIIYQGLDTSFTDPGILNFYSPVYYTAFVYDIFGNVSSGAVALVYAKEVYPDITEGNNLPINLPTEGGGEVVIVEEATSTINTERVKPDMKMPEPSDIWLVQRGIEYSLLDPQIDLDMDESFVVMIPRTAIAGNLKSIIVTIVDPTNNRQQYSFLLRLNKDRSAYEATVAPLGIVGRSVLTVQIYDYEAFVLATYRAPVTFSDYSNKNLEAVVWPDVLFEFGFWPWLLFLLLIILLFIFIYRREAEDKE